MNDNYLSGEKLIWQGRPSWRSMWAFYIKWGVVALLPLLVSVIVAAKTDSDSYWKITLLFGAAAMALVLLIGVIKRIDVKYRITTRRISIQQGILSKEYHGGQIKHIRGVEYKQSLLDRLIGIGTVEVTTAGTDLDDAVYPFRGVRSPGALVERIEEYIADDPSSFDDGE